jgi:predicted short-subunit dehydrogenase-like oxidoreductase (DUF2520 family)
MDVGIVGPGRAGTLLATACARAGMRVVGVAGGAHQARTRLAGLVAGVRVHDEAAALAERARLLVLAVPDDAIAATADALAVADAIGTEHRVVHLSGAQGLAPLRRAALTGARVAACHPAMTIPTGSHDPDTLVGVAWGVTASPDDRGWAHALVTDLGGDPHDVDEGRRALYHAGLTLGSNAAAAAVAAARQLLLAARIERPEVFLAPLVEASVANVFARGAPALTGPVVRGDLGTLARHLEAVDADLPSVADAYRHLATAVLALARPSLPPDTAAAIEALLAARQDGPAAVRPDTPPTTGSGPSPAAGERRE